MIKVSKYSIKSEAAIHGCTIKKLLHRKKSMYEPLKLQAYILNLFFKKKLLHTCFHVRLAKYFSGPFLQNTPGWLLLQNMLLFFTSTSATKCNHWSCFFLFTLNVFRANISLFWKSGTTSYDHGDTILNLLY